MSQNNTTKAHKNILGNLLIDFLSLFLSTFIVSTLQHYPFWRHVQKYFIPFGLYFVFFILLSIVFKKYEHKELKGFYYIFGRMLIVWIISSVTFLAAIILISYSRFVNLNYIILWLILFFIFQILFYIIQYAFRYAIDLKESMELDHRNYILHTLKWTETFETERSKEDDQFIRDEPIPMPEDLEIIYNPEVRKFIHYYSFKKRNKRLLLNTTRRFNIQSYQGLNLDQIVNIRKINRIQYINKFFETAHAKLKMGGIFIICCETLDMRKRKINNKFLAPIAFIIRLYDYVIFRIWPRLPYLRKIYFMFFKNANKRISYAEALGRLYSCGFEYVDELKADGKLWIAARKSHEPAFDFNVTYGPIVKLRRIGKDKKEFYVYKFRTMHPYSEYLQDFVYKRNSLDEGGKFKNDFRVSTLGKFLRKTWLDELPMLYNLIKGDLKIVGVRPLSKHYFNLYPKDMQELRTKFKPGLIPPFYYDLPKTFEEIIESERRYLEAYQKNKFLTDLRYFFKALYNIVIKRARSK